MVNKTLNDPIKFIDNNVYRTEFGTHLCILYCQSPSLCFKRYKVLHTQWILHDSADSIKALTFSCHKQIQHHNIVINNEHTHQVTYSKAFKTYQIPHCPESYNVGTLTYIENEVCISHMELAIFCCCNCHRFKSLKQQQVDHKDTVFTGMWLQSALQMDAIHLQGLLLHNVLHYIIYEKLRPCFPFSNWEHSLYT